MAVSFVDVASVLDTQTSGKTVSKPGGVANGDVAVFFLYRWDSFPAVTPPANAVEITGSPITIGVIETRVYAAYVGSETDYTFAWTGSVWSTLIGLFFTGADGGLDLAALPFDSLTGSGTAVGTTTVTTVADAGLAWSDNSMGYSSGGTHTPPTGFTEIVEDNSGSAAYRVSPGSGSQSAAGASHTESQDWIATLVALAPDGGGGITLAIGQVTESGTAHELTSSKARAIGRAAGAGEARVFGSAKASALGRVTGAGTASALGSDKVRPLGRVTEVGSARPLAGIVELSRITETGSVRALTGAKARQLGRVVESAAPRALGVAKARQVGRISATGVIRSFTLEGDTTIGRVTGGGLVRPLAGEKTIPLGRVTEAGEVRQLVRVLTFGRVVESGTARGLTSGKVKAFARVAESGAVRGLFAGVPPPIPDRLTLVGLDERLTLVGLEA